jgi:hypothetical protein
MSYGPTGFNGHYGQVTRAAISRRESSPSSSRLRPEFRSLR